MGVEAKLAPLSRMPPRTPRPQSAHLLRAQKQASGQAKAVLRQGKQISCVRMRRTFPCGRLLPSMYVPVILRRRPRTRCCPFRVFSSLKLFSKNEEGIHHSSPKRKIAQNWSQITLHQNADLERQMPSLSRVKLKGFLERAFIQFCAIPSCEETRFGTCECSKHPRNAQEMGWPRAWGSHERPGRAAVIGRALTARCARGSSSRWRRAARRAPHRALPLRR